jgi:hypothetical protein
LTSLGVYGSPYRDRKLSVFVRFSDCATSTELDNVTLENL